MAPLSLSEKIGVSHATPVAIMGDTEEERSSARKVGGERHRSTLGGSVSEINVAKKSYVSM